MVYLLALLAAALPLYLVRFRIGPFPTTALEVFIVCIIGIFAAHSIRMRQFPQIPPRLRIPIILFALSATASVFISPNTSAALGLWRAYFLEPLLIFLVAISAIRTSRDRSLVIGGLAVGALAVSAYAIAQKFTGFGIPPAWFDPAARRVTSFFGYPNSVGLYLGPLIPIFLMRILPLPLRERARPALVAGVGVRGRLAPLFFGIIALSSIIAIIFAKSFGAVAGVAAALIIIGLRIKKTRALTVACVALVAFGIATTSLKKPFSDEFLLQGYSGKLRIAMWAETIEMLKSRPLFGAGISGYQTAVAPYHIYPWAEIYLYPHNIILNFWSEIGLAGLIAFLWMLAILVRMTWLRLRSPSHLEGESLPRTCCGGWGEGEIALGLFGSFIVIFIHGLVDVPYFKNDLSVLFWLIAALTMSVSRDTISTQ